MDCALLPKRAPTPAAVIALPAVPVEPASLLATGGRLLLAVLRSLLFNGVVELLEELTADVASLAEVAVVVTEGDASEVGALSETATVSDPDEDDPETLLSEEFPLLLLVVFMEVFGDKLLLLVVLVSGS